ncbi:MAG: redoxin family protein [Christensenellales bacterium]
MKKRTLPLLLALMLLLLLPIAGARAFSGTKELDGSSFDASIMRQRITLVNIWSTTCGPCRAEIPALAQIAKDYQGRLNVVGILVNSAPWDQGQAAVPEANSLLLSAGAEYPNLLMDNSLIAFVFGDAGNISIPLTHFVNVDGSVVKTRVGSLSYDGWKDLIDEVIEEQGAPLPLPGDANDDKKVDLQDLVALIDYLVSGTAPKSVDNANANGQGGVDIQDLVWIIDQIVGG